MRAPLAPGRADSYVVHRSLIALPSAYAQDTPVQSKAKTVAQYLKELPADRRETVEAVRKVVLENMDPALEEGMQYGMICWYVPHKVFPPGYHCDPKIPLSFAALASQKNYLSLYLMSVYADDTFDEKWFRTAWAKTGKKLDMGKCCLRFKSVDDLALDVIADAFKRVRVEDHLAAYAKLDPRNRPKAAKSPKADKSPKASKSPKADKSPKTPAGKRTTR